MASNGDDCNHSSASPPHVRRSSQGGQHAGLLQDAVLALAEQLKKKYIGTEIACSSGDDDAPENFDFDRAYVKLAVVSRDELSKSLRRTSATGDLEKDSHTFSSAAKSLRNIELHRVFYAKRSLARKLQGKSLKVVALSCAGAGKTTIFTKKGPRDWALGRIWQRFVLVAALELRKPSVRKAANALELFAVGYHGFTDKGDLKEIGDYIRVHPDRICVILDGLDETKLSACSDFVKGVISGEFMPGIRLLLTSRHSSEVMKLTAKFHRRVEVLGFQREDVDRYIRSRLPADEAADVLAKLKTNPQLAAIMQTPFFAAATCKLYRSGEDLPDTLGTIFSSLILNVVQQRQKDTAGCQPYSDWSSVPKGIADDVLELGFFAFQMLIRKKMVFSETDIGQFEVSSSARSLGLLVVCDKESVRTNEQWRFSHLAIQESLAARHIASCNLSARDTAWLVHQLGVFTGHLSTFWLLMAAVLKGDGADALVNAILNPQALSACHQTPARGETGAEGHRVTHFLCASRDDIAQWAEHLSHQLSRDLVERLAIQLLSDHIGLAWPQLAVESHVRPAEVERTVDFTEALLLRWRRLVPRANTQMLYDAIACFAPGLAVRCFASVPSSVTARVRYERSTSESRLALLDSSPVERRQRLLFACRCFSEYVNAALPQQRSAAPVASLRDALEEFGLDLQLLPLTPADCRAVNAVLVHHHRHVTKVKLSGCCIGDEGYTCLADGLALCRNLEYLYLDINYLGDEHAAHVGTLVRSNAPTLRGLNTAVNALTSAGNASVHRYTPLCSALLALAVGGRGSTEVHANVANATRILDSCRRLQAVCLYDYTIGNDGLARLQPLLASLQLEMLVLGKAGLTPECAPVMREVIERQRDHLQWLDLSRNELTDSFLRDVRSSLCQCSKLELVWLLDDRLTSASLPVLASVLPSWPRLRHHHLGRNDFHDGGDDDDGPESFVRAVESCSSLLVLSMPEVRLVDLRIRHALLAQRRGGMKVKFWKGRYYDEVVHEEQLECDGEAGEEDDAGRRSGEESDSEEELL